MVTLNIVECGFLTNKQEAELLQTEISTEDCGGSGKRNCSVYGRKVRVLIFWELSFNTRIILLYLRYLRSLQQK